MKKLRYIIIIILCMFIFSACSINSNNDKSITDKTTEEINYIGDNTFSIVNKLVKDEYNIDGKINWEEVNKDVEQISGTLDTIMLDLAEVKITNEELISLRNEVDNISMAVGNKDDVNLLESCSYLYSLLPKYFEKYSNDKNKSDIMRLKGYVLTSFIEANLLDWEQAKKTVILAESKYTEMMDNVEYIRDYSYNLNKIYILLGEFKNSIEMEELELAKTKYINFIEKI